MDEIIRQIIDWCNSNEGFMTAILTLAIVMITTGQFLAARRSNKLTKEAMVMSSRPFIIIDLYPENEFIKLRVKNAGVSPATNVSIAFDKEPTICNDTLFRTLKNIPIIGPGIELKFFMDERSPFMNKNKNVSTLNGKVLYNGLFSKEKYEEPIIIDMLMYAGPIETS